VSKKIAQKVTAGIFACVALSMAFATPTAVAPAIAEEATPLHVLWIQDYQREGDTASFAIKTTAKNTQQRKDFQSDAFAYISINGYTLTEIMDADENARVDLDGVYLRVSVSAEGYAYCFDGTTDDTIVVEEGFSFISGEVTPYTFTYTYDLVFKKFMVVPDTSLLDESRYASTVLHDVVFDSTNERQVFIHFTYPIGLEYTSCIQCDPEEMARQFRSIGWSDPSDLYISQLSLFGIRESILTGIIIDGKSLKEWIYEDGLYVSDPQNLVQLSLLGSWDRGSYLTVLFGEASSCNLTDNEKHVITIKKGTTFPTYTQMVTDTTLTYDPVTNVWGSELAEEEIKSDDVKVETGEKEEGCASKTGVGTVVFAFGVAVLGVCALRKKKEGLQ
jgi:hypothetical protein